MPNGKPRWLPLALCLLSITANTQEAKLEAGRPVEREIAGGEAHTYQITLQAGQFLRVVVEQKAIDVALVLAAPDGKRMVEVNLTSAGGLESLSAEAAASGDYRLSLRAPGAAALRAAQVEMWKQKQWQSPYYWAAFAMQGEWK